MFFQTFRDRLSTRILDYHKDILQKASSDAVRVIDTLNDYQERHRFEDLGIIDMVRITEIKHAFMRIGKPFPAVNNYRAVRRYCRDIQDEMIRYTAEINFLFMLQQWKPRIIDQPSYDNVIPFRVGRR